jgi:geranylgeranyl diphosphate synthase type I
MRTTQQNSFTKTLEEHQSSINKFLEDYFNDIEKSFTGKYGRYSSQSFSEYISVALRGGKRIRGALVLESYKLHCGNDFETAIRLASAIEIIHAYLLIIDDFCDESETRRGKLSANKALQQKHQKSGWKGDSLHFGDSIAINIALLGKELATNLIISLPIDSSIKINILENLSASLIITGHGQINDIYNEVLPTVSDTMINNVLSWKTGYYSFFNPIEVGAILAMPKYIANQDLINYSIALGNAFQIKDDVIGIYGDDKKTGKSNLDDIKEGKMTILYKKGIELANQKDSKYLYKMLGNTNIESRDLVKIRTILSNCGALAEANQIIENNITEATNSLDRIKSGSKIINESLNFFYDLCVLVATRES